MAHGAHRKRHRKKRCLSSLLFVLLLASAAVLLCWRFDLVVDAWHTVDSLVASAVSFLSAKDVASDAIYENDGFSADDKGIFADDAEEGNGLQGVGFDYYVRSRLSGDDREKYDLMLEALLARTTVDYPEADADDIERISDYVLFDHPELFYVQSIYEEKTIYQKPGEEDVVEATLRGNYTYTEEEIARYGEQIERQAEAFLTQISDEADDYEKAKAAYEYIIENTDYDLDAYNAYLAGSGDISGQSIVDVFVDRKALCEGYAKAFQYLLQKMGITCAYVSGVADGESHGWCVALLDGYYYYIDPTFGDPQKSSTDGTVEETGEVSYAYLCLTEEDMEHTHTADVSYLLPDCVSMRDNYYVREGLYLAEADIEIVGNKITQAVSAGKTTLSLRCSNDEVFEALKAKLLQDNTVFRYLPESTYSYFEIASLDILTLNW